MKPPIILNFAGLSPEEKHLLFVLTWKAWFGEGPSDRAIAIMEKAA